jgi:hypothetical protein
VFYSTLYTSKSTQEEDSEKQLRIGRAIVKRIQRLLNDQSLGDTLKEQCNQVTLESSFREGVCRVLSGLNAATTRNIISATMAHLIPSNSGLRFVFSHDFSDLLVGQMEATLEGQDINVCIRTNKLHDGQLISWGDSLADDYIHRPLGENFEMMSYYEMTQQYKKVFKTLRREGEDRYKFSETHPGYEFSNLMKFKHPTIPRIALPKEKLCPLKDLQLNTTKPTEESFDKRDIYAKMVLLMFYPFRCLNDLTIEESYWEKFSQELQRHLDQKIAKFSQQGFRVLQNINDRMTLQKQLKRANDPIYMTTKNEKPITDNNKNNVKKIIMNQTSSKWDCIQGDILQSNSSNYEYFDNHSYFTMMSLNSVMITTIALLMIHHYQENYLTWRLSTDTTFGMIISLMHNNRHRNLLYNKISQRKQTLKNNKISILRK